MRSKKRRRRCAKLARFNHGCDASYLRGMSSGEAVAACESPASADGDGDSLFGSRRVSGFRVFQRFTALEAFATLLIPLRSRWSRLV